MNTETSPSSALRAVRTKFQFNLFAGIEEIVVENHQKSECSGEQGIDFLDGVWIMIVCFYEGIGERYEEKITITGRWWNRYGQSAGRDSE